TPHPSRFCAPCAWRARPGTCVRPSFPTSASTSASSSTITRLSRTPLPVLKSSWPPRTTAPSRRFNETEETGVGRLSGGPGRGRASGSPRALDAAERVGRADRRRRRRLDADRDGLGPLDDARALLLLRRHGPEEERALDDAPEL